MTKMQEDPSAPRLNFDTVKYNVDIDEENQEGVAYAMTSGDRMLLVYGFDIDEEGFFRMNNESMRVSESLHLDDSFLTSGGLTEKLREVAEEQDFRGIQVDWKAPEYEEQEQKLHPMKKVNEMITRGALVYAGFQLHSEENYAHKGELEYRITTND